MKKGIFMFLVITIFMNFSLTAFANEKKIVSSVYNKNGKTSREELKTVIGTKHIMWFWMVKKQKNM